MARYPITTKEEYDRAVQRVVGLARNLPCLAEAEGLDPFDPLALEKWTAAKERTPLQLHCGRLVLTAYHPLYRWRCGYFDLDVACWSWDDAHREAFTRWAQDPVFVWNSMVPVDLRDENLDLDEMVAMMLSRAGDGSDGHA